MERVLTEGRYQCVRVRGEIPPAEAKAAISTPPINSQQERNISFQVAALNETTTRTFGAVQSFATRNCRKEAFSPVGSNDFYSPSRLHYRGLGSSRRESVHGLYF